MGKNKTILIIATLDTKGPEALFVKNLIEGRGIRTLVMDPGVVGDAYFKADIPADKVAGAASYTLPELISLRDESKAMEEMAKGAETITTELFEKGAFDGIIALGGTIGTALALRVFRKLPIGVTKVLVSTVAVSHFVTPQNVSADVVMVQVAADLWGLNRLVRRDLRRAALAVACAVENEKKQSDESVPLIDMTTLGGSYLKYASVVKEKLEREGYEVALFHSVSIQGAIMERIIEEEKVQGVLDLCPLEVLAEVCGGYCCSPGRMEAAVKIGIPQIVGPGGLGVFPWGSLENIPERFKGRPAKSHNEIITAIKASKEEMAETARVMASKLNRSTGSVIVVIPEKGFFEYDRPGEFFYDPEGRKTFIVTLRDNLRPEIEFVVLDSHINDPEYAEKVSDIALSLFKRGHSLNVTSLHS